MVFLVHCYWNAPGKILRHYRGARLSKPLLNIVFKPYLSEGHRESGNKTGSLSQLLLWLIFGDLLTRGQNDLKKIKVITVSVGYCTLPTSLIVNLLFRLAASSP